MFERKCITFYTKQKNRFEVIEFTNKQTQDGVATHLEVSDRVSCIDVLRQHEAYLATEKYDATRKISARIICYKQSNKVYLLT